MEKYKYIFKGALHKVFQSEITRRAFHTFYQTAIAVFLAGIPLVVSAYEMSGVNAGLAVLVSVATGAVAAGLSAVKTVLLSRVKG